MTNFGYSKGYRFGGPRERAIATRTPPFALSTPLCTRRQLLCIAFVAAIAFILGWFLSP